MLLESTSLVPLAAAGLFFAAFQGDRHGTHAVAATIHRQRHLLPGDTDCRYWNVTGTETIDVRQILFLAGTTDCVRAVAYVSETPLTDEEATSRELDATSWSVLCDSNVLGLGSDVHTVVPAEDCLPMSLPEGETRYFYLSMTSLETSECTEGGGGGSLIYTDLSTSYDMGMYEQCPDNMTFAERLFSHAPSSSPSSSPTKMPAATGGGGEPAQTEPPVPAPSSAPSVSPSASPSSGPTSTPAAAEPLGSTVGGTTTEAFLTTASYSTFGEFWETPPLDAPYLGWPANNGVGSCHRWAHAWSCFEGEWDTESSASAYFETENPMDPPEANDLSCQQLPGYVVKDPSNFQCCPDTDCPNSADCRNNPHWFALPDVPPECVKVTPNEGNPQCKRHVDPFPMLDKNVTFVPQGGSDPEWEVLIEINADYQYCRECYLVSPAVAFYKDLGECPIGDQYDSDVSPSSAGGSTLWKNITFVFPRNQAYPSYFTTYVWCGELDGSGQNPKGCSPATAGDYTRGSTGYKEVA